MDLAEAANNYGQSIVVIEGMPLIFDALLYAAHDVERAVQLAMATFEPTKFNFIRLRDFRIPGKELVYEFKNHPAVDGKSDFLRLNLYLTIDGNYVTIWFGLLEPMFTEESLGSSTKPEDFDFTTYNETLFRGHIDSDEAAGHILKALRVGESSRYAKPQALSTGTDNKLKCDWM